MSLSQSIKKLGRDPVPQIRPAGVPGNGNQDGSIYAELHHEKPPPTPDHVKPFRKTFTQRVGRAGRHYGLRNDEELDECTRFGRKSVYDGSAEETINPKTEDRLNALAAENAEKNYLSSKREPLGKTPVPAFALPEKLIRDGFGVPSKSSESAKVIIYSCGDKEAKPVHVPGEQKSRRYDWAKVGIDPTKTRFGSVPNVNEGNSTKELFGGTSSGTSKILPNIVRDYHSTNVPSLGRSINHGFGSRPQNADFTYGKTVKQDEMNVRMLLSGAGTPAEDLVDPTLGHTVTLSPTLRKQRKDDEANKTLDRNRIFGIPSIRNDLPRPRFLKVTTVTNYGDDVGAAALLYPNRYIRSGIEERYFNEPRTLEGIREIIKNQQNFGLTEEQIQEAFSKASDGEGKASVEKFKDAVNDLKF